MRTLLLTLLCVSLGLTMVAGEQPLSRAELRQAMSSLPKRGEVAFTGQAASRSASQSLHRHMQQRAVAQGGTVTLNVPGATAVPWSMIAAMDQYALVQDEDGNPVLDNTYSDESGAYMGLRSQAVEMLVYVNGKSKIWNLNGAPSFYIYTDAGVGTASIHPGQISMTSSSLPSEGGGVAHKIVYWYLYPESYLFGPDDAQLEDIEGCLYEDGSIYIEEGFVFLKKVVISRMPVVSDWNRDTGSASLNAPGGSLLEATITYEWSSLINNLYLLPSNGVHSCYKGFIAEELTPYNPADTTGNDSTSADTDPFHIDFENIAVSSDFEFIDFSDPSTTVDPNNWSGHKPVKRPPENGVAPPIFDDPVNPGVSFDVVPISGLGDALNGYLDPSTFKSSGVSQGNGNGSTTIRASRSTSGFGGLDRFIDNLGGGVCFPDNWGGRNPVKRPPGDGGPGNGSVMTGGLDVLGGNTNPFSFNVPHSSVNPMTKEPVEAPVFIWQSADTVWVLNLYENLIDGNGTWTCMTVNADGTMSFPLQDVAYYSTGTVGRNFTCLIDSVQNDIILTPGVAGAVSPEMITWENTALQEDASSAPDAYYIQNKLYFVDENQCFSLGDRIGISDVTTAINRVLTGNPDVSISDVTRMINRVLNSK